MAKRRSEEAPTEGGSVENVDSQSAQSSGSSTNTAESDELVRTVNGMPPAEFKKHFITNELLTYTSTRGSADRTVRLDFKSSSELPKADLAACFALVETTSRADYEPSSFGWHPKRKRREMLEDEMKYLLVRMPAGEQAGEAVEGFLSYMVTHDSIPSVPVLYVYEIHLSEKLRKTGLGSHLMHLAERIATSIGLEKVMLTCFLSNEKALEFYRRHGYEKDICSPDDRRTRKKVVKVDYMIMSKRVRETGKDNGG